MKTTNWFEHKSEERNWTCMSENGFNTTMNGTQPSSCSINTAEKIGETFAYCLIFVVSLAGNTIIGLIVYKTKTMRKPINFLIVNMASPICFYPLFCSLLRYKSSIQTRGWSVVLLARPYVNRFISYQKSPLLCPFRAWFW